MSGILKISRFHVSAQAFIYMLVGVYLADGLQFLLSMSVIIPGFVVILVISFGFVINDLQDIEVDSINKPNHPIPSGIISKERALLLAFLYPLLALIISSQFEKILLGIVILNISISTIYSIYLKSTFLIGNFAIAYLNASVIFYGSLLVGEPTNFIYLICLIVFLFTCVQEIIYNIVDIVADRAVGWNTTAVRLGEKKAIILFFLFVLLYASVATLPLVFGLASIWYMFTITISSILPLIVSAVILMISSKNYRVQQVCKVVKVVRLLSLVVIVTFSVGLGV